MHRPGTELAISRLQVRRPTTTDRAGPSRATAGPGKPLSRGPITTHRRRKGEGVSGRWGARAPPPQKIGKIFFWQLSCKIQAFSGKYHVNITNIIRLRVWGSVVSSPSRVRPKMDFMHISGQKEAIWNTFSVFLSDGGAPKRRGARENFPLFPPCRRS